MNRRLRERRDGAVARHDAALSRFPTRQGAAFQAEMKAVVDDLTAVATAADAPSSDVVELAKTYRWLGDACFDLSLGTDEQLLTRGAQAYGRSDELLAGVDTPVEKAKLDFNYGNTLRALSRGFDVGLLEAAATRYENAARIFRSHHLADLAATVEQQKLAIAAQLRLATKYAGMQKGQARLAELGKRLETANAAERDRIASELQDLREKLPARDDVREILAEATGALRPQLAEHPERLAESGSDLTQLEEATQRLVDVVEPARPTPAREADPEIAAARSIAGVLTERLRKEAAAGTVSPDRAARLGDTLKQFIDAMSAGGDDLASLASRAAKMREISRQVMDSALSPSWPTPTPEAGSRASRLLAILEPLKRYLVAEQGRAMQPSGERSRSFDLLTRLATLEARIRELAPEERKLADAEDETWRVALDVLEDARRYHLMLIQPIFPTASNRAEPKAVFLSGGEQLLGAARVLEQREGLHLYERARSGDRARERWNQLCAAAVAVFDAGVADPALRAQVCYELGLALALGKPSVVATRTGLKLPFNVDLQPITLGGGADVDSSPLRDGIEQALSSIVWGGSEAHLGKGPVDALEWLDRHFVRRLSDGPTKIAMEMARAACDDAVAFRRALDFVLGLLGGDAPAAVLPAWPPVYPSAAGKPHLFHVMPFRPRWAKPTRDIAEAVCRAKGWTYSRGDEADEQRVIRGIWTEIARASAVLVDITNLNPNVALELGLVHAIGRPYRIVTQGRPDESLFESLEKLQIHAYRGGPEYRNLAEQVEALLATARPMP